MLPPHRLFLWSLVIGLLLSSNHAAAQEEAVEEAESPAGRRQLWDFFSLLDFVYHGPCVPGPRGAGCRANQNDQGEDEETEETQSGNTASAATTQESASNYYAEPSDTEAYAAETAAETAGKQTGIFGNTNASFAWFMIATAGSVMAALLAVHMGQRKNSSSAQRHEMSGAVMRRMGAVSAFAGAALPGRSKTVELGGVETTPGYEMA